VADVPAGPIGPDAASKAARADAGAWAVDRARCGFPVLLLIAWQSGGVGDRHQAHPDPAPGRTDDVRLRVCGIYDDAFSGTILTHMAASFQRVYSGFGLAILVGIPLGLLIGRVAFIRQLLDPTLSVLRPVRSRPGCRSR